jgi:hypothetical protein
MHFQLVIAAIIVLAFFKAPEAYANDRTPVGFGPHSRKWSAMGNTAARGAESVQYNPANLSFSQPFEIQYEASLISLSYAYSYPGFQDVEISKTTVIPFVGLSGKIGPSFAWGGYLIPIPEDSESAELQGVPTRKVSAIPVAVNVNQTGNGLGIKSGLGAALQISDAISAGAGLVYNKSGSLREVYSADIGLKVLTTTTETSETRLRLGVVYDSDLVAISLASVVFGSNETTGSEETFGLFGNKVADVGASTKFPLNISVGTELKLGKMGLLGDFAYHQWKAVYDQEKFDVFSTIDFMVGGRYSLSKSTGVFTSYAFFPGYKGDGLIASANPTGQEIAGMDIGEIDAISRNSVAGGIDFGLGRNQASVFANYQFGQRESFENGIAAGDHSLSVFYVGFSGQYQFGSSKTKSATKTTSKTKVKK